MPQVSTSPDGFVHSEEPRDAAQHRRLVAVLDQQDAMPAARRLRAWALERLALVAGESVVDVGSGTGTVVQLLAEQVAPDGTVIGVEPDGSMRATAAERLSGLGRVDIREGIAQKLPLADDSIDALWCERVLQHLDDPATAVAEFARVLRPGGRLAVLDSDHGTDVAGGVDAAVWQRAIAAMAAAYPNPYAARELPGQLQEAGLELDPDVGSVAYLSVGEVLPPPVRMVLTAAAESEAITGRERDEAMATLERREADGTAFASVTVYAFIARKPDDR